MAKRALQRRSRLTSGEPASILATTQLNSRGTFLMTNYDLRLDLPARAFINAQLASLMEKGGTAWDAKKHLFSSPHYASSGLDPYTYTLWDHSVAIGLLYSCVVVPREFLDLSQNDAAYQDFDSARICDLFENLEPSAIDSYKLLRCLRNSVAHALFSVEEQNSEWRYEFWTGATRFFVLESVTRNSSSS